MRHFFVALFVLAAAACRSPAPPSVAAPPETARSPGSPIEASWVVRETSATSAKLTLNVMKAAVTEKDVSVELLVPPGATLEPSTLRWFIPAAQTGDVVTEVEVRWTTVPATDLQAIVDMQGVAMGFHALVPYRFGRPEPQVVQPPHDTPNVRIGNSDIGSPVDLNKQ